MLLSQTQGVENALVPLTMFGCILAFLAVFGFMQPRRAVIACFLGAWLFLPVKTYEFEGIPDYSKLFATCFGITVAVFVFDFKQMLRFRPHWVDIPMILWCFIPVASSLTNDVPVSNRLYDGLSESLSQIILWGFPYFLGRIYFTNWKELRELAIGILSAGLLYIPLILTEMIFSPQLHRWVYGYHQHRFDQTSRFGLWRPMVFMNHGLMVALFMAAAALIAFWLWRSKSIETVQLPFGLPKIPFFPIALLMLGIVIFMVSANAWAATLLGITTLLTAAYFRTRLIAIFLLIFIPTYIGMNVMGVWPQDQSVKFMVGLFGPERAQSLEFRYWNEDLLSEKARNQPFFGWGGWNRQIVTNEWGLRTVIDSGWISVVGKFGVVGLISWLLCILTPPLLILFKYPTDMWKHPKIAPTIVLSVILMLYMFDFLLNNMINPVYMLAAGALLGAYSQAPEVDELYSRPNPSQKKKLPSVEQTA